MDEAEPPETLGQGPLGPHQLAYFRRDEDWAQLLESVSADRAQAETLTRVYRARAEAENARRQLLVHDPRLRELTGLTLLDPRVFDRGLDLYLETLEPHGEAS